MIQHTATEYAPWYVVPADNKWFTRIVVASAVIDAMASLESRVPEAGAGHARRTRAGRGASSWPRNSGAEQDNVRQAEVRGTV